MDYLMIRSNRWLIIAAIMGINNKEGAWSFRLAQLVKRMQSMVKRVAFLLLILALILAGSWGCLRGQKPTETPGPVKPEQTMPATGIAVPILYYHLIDDHLYGPYPSMFVSPKEFDKQMNYLKNNGYTVIPLDEIEQSDRYTKPVIITFDDGYADNYTNAYLILKKYSFKATIFLISGLIGKPGYLNKDEIRQMQDLVSFQSHTVSHPYLTRLSAKLQDYELAESQKEIEAITGSKVDALAYPIGDYNQQVIDIARHYYKYAVLMVPGGIYHTGDDPYLIKRLNIQRGLGIDDFAKKVRGLPS